MNRETLNRDEQTNNGAYARSSSNAVKHSPKSKTLWASATAGPTRLALAERGILVGNGCCIFAIAFPGRKEGNMADDRELWL
jgi:hypothetical protein